jgi:ribosomal protein L7Ae-like RNA K-turn-binding protein
MAGCSTPQNSKKRVQSFTIDSPVNLKWTPIDNETSQKTMQLLIKFLINFCVIKIIMTTLYRSLSDVNLTHGRKSLQAHQKPNENSSKKEQLVIGLNAFTRCLERGKLLAGVVCLSAKPAVIHQHILMLTATKKCPVMAIHNMSNKLSPILGIKSTLALGFKVYFLLLSSSSLSSLQITDAAVNDFSEVIAHISSNSPAVDIPWLPNMEMEDCRSSGNNKKIKLELDNDGNSYISLQVKKILHSKS